MTVSDPYSVKAAVIPAAGLGTRFLPLTKSQPKEMLPLVDKPAIQYVVEEAVAAGITDILVITGRGKRAIEDHFDRNFELDFALREKGKFAQLETLEEIESLANIHYIRQLDPKGLGHAVSVAHSHIGNEPFAVMLGDDIMVDDAQLLRNMVKDFSENQASVVGLLQVAESEISNYGCASLAGALDPNRESDCVEINGVVEKPAPGTAPSNLAVIGRYIFTPAIFECIDEITPGVGGELQLTDAIALLLERDKVFGRTFVHGRHDVGQKVDWLLANVSVALERDDLSSQVREGLRKILGYE